MKKLYFIRIEVKKLQAGDTFFKNLGKILANDPTQQSNRQLVILSFQDLQNFAVKTLPFQTILQAILL